LLFLFSCDVKEKYKDPLLDFEKTELVISTPIHSSESIFKANDMLMIGDHLIIHDPELDYIYKILDISNDIFVKKFGKRGEGPCELTPLSFINRVGGSSLGIYLGSNQSYQEYNIEDILGADGDSQCEAMTYRFENFHLNFAKIDSCFSIGYGMYDQPYVLIYGNQIVQNVGDFPFRSEFANTSNGSLAMAYQPRLIKHPIESRVLSTARYSFDMDFLELDKNNELQIYNKLHFWPPDFEDSSGSGEVSAAIKGDNRFGNLHTSVSENFIYVLFSDQPWNYQNPQKSNLILVYDWNGNSIKVLVDIPTKVPHRSAQKFAINSGAKVAS